ncbi:selenocysteine lyase/cysteine desulfurase [Murinocardiopsis flavida]|uniref:Selenocysteine lyase/cysteine desulfurase n=1 Tax=Murinocardiopsis flavida TaxID=645275 RepID=A0A2P8DFG1_9ACTN|nr:aminotransferase class V-fold PLP-dependent enzyme [Murinocardiopsis flavida]PSK95943.1 selenocysteine lyase/cysteine desulfurase [Murinocardiopsis flavida]
MRTDMAAEFGFDPGLTVLNHASFGVPTRELLDEADRYRRAIERDIARGLGRAFLAEARPGIEETARRLGAGDMAFAFTSNTSEGASAVAAGWPLEEGDAVVLGSAEYPPVVRAWRQAAERARARVVLVDLPLPWTAEGWRHALAAAAQETPVAAAHNVVGVVSLVASAPGAAPPLAEFRTWLRGLGGSLVVDAAHGPGHVDLDIDGLGADAVFGTLHKWLPIPRGAGFLAVREEYAHRIVPPVVSHTHDAAALEERFAMPGSFDPVPRLLVASAWRTWQEWEDAGLLKAAVGVADTADVLLSEAGLRPTSEAGLRAPRLRGFSVPGLPVPEVAAVLADAGLHAWLGPLPDGTTGLRVATHVWSEPVDIERLADTLRPHVAGAA